MSLIRHTDLTAAELRPGDVIVDGYDADLYRWLTVKHIEESPGTWHDGRTRVCVDFDNPDCDYALWRADAEITVERIYD